MRCDVVRIVVPAVALGGNDPIDVQILVFEQYTAVDFPAGHRLVIATPAPFGGEHSQFASAAIAIIASTVGVLELIGHRRPFEYRSG